MALITGEAFIRGRRLFQCRYPKVRYLLKGGVYLRVWLLAKYSNYSDKHHIKEMWGLLEGGAYFNVDTQKCGAYKREALIRGNFILLGLAQL